MNNQKQVELPTRLLNVSRLPAKGVFERLSADTNELQAAAGHCQVNSFEEISAELSVKPWHRNGVSVSGEISVKYEQTCVVSLEPIFVATKYGIDVKLLPETSSLSRSKKNEEGELILDFEGDDPPECFEGDEVDLWSLVFEQMVLEIDPYPKKGGALIGQDYQKSEEPSDSVSPFAVLKSLTDDKFG